MSRIRRRDLVARAEEFESEYDITMIKELLSQINETIEEQEAKDVYAEDIETIVVKWQDALPDINDWCWAQVNNEIEDIADQQRQLCKEEGIC